MQLTQGLRRNQSLNANRTATVFGDRRRTWGDLADRVSRLASGLHRWGIRSGDRVGVLALNSDRYIETYYAIARAGAVAVPMNTRWAKAEIEFAVSDSQPGLLIVDAAFAEVGHALASGGLQTIELESGGTGSFEDIIAKEAPIQDALRGADDLAGIFYTGGTTGRSKGVMLTHGGLATNFLMMCAVAPFPRDAVFLHTPPMFHLADAACVFGVTMLGGAHVVLPGFEPVATLKAIEEHRINSLVLVPTMIGMLCEALRTQTRDTSSVRRIAYGASPISEAVLTQAMTAFPNAEFGQAYGQTELSPVATILDHADHLAGRLRSAGRAIPGVDLRIVDEKLGTVPTGVVGEVAVRGPTVMRGYWGQPDLTAQTIVDGWLRTGDAGYLDDGGYLYLVDRMKDMIVSGGENVYSAEVENALMQHPAVLQCAVIGVPDETWGERVHAVLCLRDGLSISDADLADHCKPFIANYKRPRSFEVRDSPLPLSGAGKVLKTELRRPHWEGVDRKIG
ncbi:MAG TPA: long-chain fatty acid--CoA ligase [Caulobacteraceae bacterium]|jgi:long-chain acyl-CoA synthetase